jgi:hypothetical protein
VGEGLITLGQGQSSNQRILVRCVYVNHLHIHGLINCIDTTAKNVVIYHIFV